MPRRQPFTLLCQAAAKLANPTRADLHTHTTASDGDFTPSQLVAHARNAGLTAIAITDHDTTAGLAEARTTARSFERKPIEIITGVEVSTHHAGRDYHLLGYFVDLESPVLQTNLAAIRVRRRERFFKHLDAFKNNGLTILPHLIESLLVGDIALGRRHLAKLLVASGHANTNHIAFLKHIIPQRIHATHNVSLADAIGWIHKASGIASLAHPPADITIDDLTEMKSHGLDAVESNCPSVPYQNGIDLASCATKIGLTTTAGSDYHGDGHVLGSRCVTLEQLAALRDLSHRSGSERPAASQQL